MTNGFVYAATGEKWCREAVASATRLRLVHPDVPIALFTDDPAAVASDVFDIREPLPDRPWRRSAPKLWAVAHSPFDRSVFLDTDTYVCNDVSELFVVLDRFDFAAVPAARRLDRLPRHAMPPDIPDAFQNVNAGVIAWRRNDTTDELFRLWWDLYLEDWATAGDDLVHDQPSLRVALWRSDARILHLAPEFNERTHHWRRPTVAIGPVRVIHGRPRSFEALEQRWNVSPEWRFLTPVAQYKVRQTARRIIPTGARKKLYGAIKRALRRG